MDEIQEIRQNAQAFRKQKRYSEAVGLYQALWTENRDKCNEWEGWGYAHCLRKLGKSYDALDVCRNVYQMCPDFQAGKNLYAWCIYDTEIRKDNETINKDEKNFFKAVNAILNLTVQDEYSPYSKTILRVVDYLSKAKISFPADDIISWLEKLDENGLSKEPFIIEDVDGKQKEIPSEKEKCYSINAKALEKLGRYKDCMDLCENALADIDGFHYSGDIWLKRRIALCKDKLGRKDEAAEGLELILQQRKEWFMQHELARIYYELGKNEKALTVAIDSALNFGKDENKWELFLLLARILIVDNMLDVARMHLLFAAKLRKKKEWSIPENLAGEINKLDLDINDPIDIRELRSKLKGFWENEKYSALPKMDGTVKTILKNGKAGFISGSDGKDYYFNISSFKGAINRLARGLKVSFVIEASYDKKKKIRSKAATHIREIQ